MTGPTDNAYPPGASIPTNQPPAGEDQSRAAAAASRAGDEAAHLKDEAVGAAAEVKERARTEVSGVAQEARAEARTVVGEIRGRIDGQASEAAQRLASSISSAADELRSMADASSRPDSPVADAVRQVADRSAQMARTIEDRGYRAVADDLARFGRNHAGMFLLAAGAAGFAVGRILRNTDAGAVVQAAKGEIQGDTSAAPVGAETGTMAGTPPRPDEVATLSGAYEPVGSGLGSR